MHSSTSSFKFILGVVMLTTSFLAIYSLLLTPFKRFPTAAQNQYQENLVKAESFLFKEPACKNLFLGSSLSFLLEESYFSESICNLSLGGESAITGLNIFLLKQPKQRFHLIVELNVLRPLSSSFIENLTGGPWNYLKKYFPILHQDSQPVTILLSALRNRFPPAAKIASPEQYEIWLNVHKKDSSDVEPGYALEYERHLRGLKIHFDQLRSEGHKITLLWMPMDPQILASPKYAWSLSEAQKLFPQGEWPWIVSGLSAPVLISV